MQNIEKMVKMQRSGVTLYCEPNEVPVMLKNGFKQVNAEGEVIGATTPETKKPKVFSRLKAEEIQKMAVMLGIPTVDADEKQISAKDLKAFIEEATTEQQIEAILQVL